MQVKRGIKIVCTYIVVPSRGGPTFSSGVQLFPGVGGGAMLISIETYRTCDFPGGWGSRPPIPHLDP